MEGRLTPELYILLNYKRALNKALDTIWEQHTSKVRLSGAQEHLLWVLHFRNGSTISELADYGLWHISTVMHLLDALEKR